MTRILKTIALLGAVLIAFGVLLSVIGFALGGARYLTRNPVGLNLFGWSDGFPGSASKNGRELAPFRSIDVTGGYLELELKPSRDGKYGVETVFDSGLKEPDCQINGDTLVIASHWPRERKSRGNRDYKVTVLYPVSASFDTLSVDLRACEMTLKNFRAEKTNVEASAASIEISNAVLGRLNLHNAAGDVHIEDSVAESAELSLNMGNLEAESFDTNGLQVDVNMGNVEISGALRGKTDISVNMGNAELAPTLSSGQYGGVLHYTAGYRDLGPGDAANLIKIDVDMGNAEVNFDD